MAEAYIHGYSSAEQARLVDQARILAPNLFSGLVFSGAYNLLEIGCGVGAALKIISERWPSLELTGVDHNRSHIAAAKELLKKKTGSCKVHLVLSDAYRLPFQEARFDLAITIWMLEHVDRPQDIMCEALRVLKTEGTLICTEVDNDTFGFEPQNDVIADWWERFNAYQKSAGGDPFVGRKLKDMAASLGCRNIKTETLAVISSSREPMRRTTYLQYLRDLLLSGAENMIEDGYADAKLASRLRNEFEYMIRDKHTAFRYHAVRLTCSPAV